VENETQVHDMARGAVFLGGGGGGDPRIAALCLVDQLRQGKRPQVIDAASLDDDAFVLPIAGVGAPTVGDEYLLSMRTLKRLAQATGSRLLISFAPLEAKRPASR